VKKALTVLSVILLAPAWLPPVLAIFVLILLVLLVLDVNLLFTNPGGLVRVWRGILKERKDERLSWWL